MNHVFRFIGKKDLLIFLVFIESLCDGDCNAQNRSHWINIFLKHSAEAYLSAVF